MPVRSVVGMVALLLVTVACSGDDDDGDATGPSTSAVAATTSTSVEPSSSVTDAGVESSATPSTSALPGPSGPGCAELPADGDGSVEGMADDPVVAAAGNNDQLTSLVGAIDAAGLTDTLNGAGPFTVFAPINSAFAVVPDLEALLAEPELLGAVLSLHIVEGQRLSVADLTGAGSVPTLGGELSFTSDGAAVTVNGAASVVCADIQTANATVHLIDGVLLPPVDEEVVAGSQLYSVDLATGATTSLGAIGSGLGVIGLAFAPADTSGVVYGLTDTPELITFETADPATVTAVPIIGVAEGSTLVAIDGRAADGSVLAVSDASVLYALDPTTGTATAIGDGINPPVTDPGVGMDIDPATDRVRLSVATGENLRVDPTTGTVEVDPATEQPVVDANFFLPETASRPRVVALAGVAGPDGATLLYGIDSLAATLVSVDSPNEGLLRTVGPLGITVTDGASFDIASNDDALLVVPG